MRALAEGIEELDPVRGISRISPCPQHSELARKARRPRAAAPEKRERRAGASLCSCLCASHSVSSYAAAVGAHSDDGQQCAGPP